MAAITTAGSGNWSSTTPNAPWPSGTVPTSADTVTIANTHTVTLDTTGCVCSTLTVASGGTLTCTTGANWDLTAQTTITMNAGSITNIDMSSSVGYVGGLYYNNSASTSLYINHISASANATVTLKGYPRKRRTALNGAIVAGATSAIVDDATGWQTGDIVCFATTQDYNATPKTDVVTLTSVSGNNIGWSGGITYDHADNGMAGNFSSNLIIGPKTYTSYGRAAIPLPSYSGPRSTKTIDNVLFYGGGTGDYQGGGQVGIQGTNGAIVYDEKLSITNCAFYQFIGAGIWLRSTTAEETSPVKYPITGCVFYSSIIAAGAYANTGYGIVSGFAVGHNFSSITGCGVFRVTGAYPGVGILAAGYGNEIDDNEVSACNIGITSTYGYTGLVSHSNYYGIGLRASSILCEDLQIGQSGLNNTDFYFQLGYSEATLKNAKITSFTPSLSALLTPSFVEFINKNQDVTAQEIYRPYCEIKRDNSTTNRSTSSISIKPTRTATDSQREQEILCANGATIRVVGYVQADANFYNSGTWTAPTVTLSGLGEATQTFTATSACNGAWEQFDLSITNNSGNDGNFTLIYTANANAVTTGTVYFDGVPDAPFVTKCRHYGFLINESSPTRTVDPYAVASESTAAAYTGVTINNTTKEISFAAGTADTAQKFYDFHQATICDNLGYDVAISRAGTLYSLLSTWTVVDPYYSGTLTWSGGTIQYSTYGTYSDNLDGCIIEFADSGGGTYTLDGTLSGTLDLRNLDADPITVEVPTGTTTTDANNTGGAITVQEPETYQSVTLTGGEAGSRVQLYDVSSSTELYNAVPGAWPFTWTDPDPYSADREIRLRVMWVDGANAKQFIDQAIGTVTEADPELTYLVAQIDDSVYNANAIDGSALTGYAIVGTNLTIDVSDGTATWAEMYAYQVYWLSTEDGIRDQDLYIQAIDTANYVFYGGFQIKNTSAPSVPLLVTGGNGEPSSGPATDLLDTSGGTIFCNSAIVVPYSSGADVTEQIVRDGLTSQGYTTMRANAIDTIPEDVWGHTLP